MVAPIVTYLGAAAFFASVAGFTAWITWVSRKKDVHEPAGMSKDANSPVSAE